MAATDPFLENSLVGAILSRRFRLKHELGRGGMGAVYAAEPLHGGPLVAIKILHASFLGDTQVLERFLEEGRTCMRLTHQNILQVYECHTAEDGSPYLVMDLLKGVPLSAYTQNGGRVSLTHAVPILHGMLAGLSAAHAEGVVHRDLKPGNVFLAREPEPEGLFVVKLLDFGIAKVMDVAGGMGNKTKTGMLLGTPAYMSPEQVTNAKDVDARTDLWSAGVMFYEMLTGRVAFPAPTEYARLAAVLRFEPEPVESVDHELALLGPFVSRALEKDRAKRFQTAREMSVALQNAVAVERRSRPDDRGSRGVAMPLSRLPDRAWVDDTGAWRPIPEPRTSPPATAPQTGLADAPIHLKKVHFELAPSASSTLASAGGSGGGSGGGSAGGSAPSSGPLVADESAPMVALEAASVGTSRRSAVAHLSAESRPSGVRGWVVVLLVLFALALGVAVGFSLARIVGSLPARNSQVVTRVRVVARPGPLLA
jgi:serine/threonine-protein kinase